LKDSNIEQLFGVWANDNSELVITNKTILLYQRKGTDFYSTVLMYKINTNQIDVYTKAVAIFSKFKEKASCKYFCNTKEKWIESGDKLDLQTPIRIKSFSIINSNSSLSISNDNETFLKLNKINNILTFNFSINANFEQIEKIQVCNFKIGEKATEDSIGKCLTKWNLGSGFLEDDKENNFTTEITTNKHSYLFTLTKWNNDKILYCRAAKIKSNNKGSIFAQNIRLMKNSNEFTAKMAENNSIISKENILIQDHLFNPKSCVFINGGEEIYWSVKEFSEDEIILNGCGGEEYKHSRPKTKSENYEYFKYESY